jgi:hypothetical protein
MTNACPSLIRLMNHDTTACGLDKLSIVDDQRMSSLIRLMNHDTIACDHDKLSIGDEERMSLTHQAHEP